MVWDSFRYPINQPISVMSDPKPAKIEKKVVVVTGGCGGIGNATAKVFKNSGWHVIGVDRRNPTDSEMANMDRFRMTDISCPDDIKLLFDTVSETEGRLDALVNNAAMQICKPALETTVDEWDAVFNANVRGVFISAQHAFPLLKAGGGGAIVNVSSVHAVCTSKSIAAYASSKGALMALTRNLALEWAEEGIRVNAVLPGAIDTTMLHSGLSRGHVEGSNVDELVRGLGNKHIMGRVGRPEEIGQSILFLADEKTSSFMTGQSIIVDGGATARLSTE